MVFVIILAFCILLHIFIEYSHIVINTCDISNSSEWLSYTTSASLYLLAFHDKSHAVEGKGIVGFISSDFYTTSLCILDGHCCVHASPMLLERLLPAWI